MRDYYKIYANAMEVYASGLPIVNSGAEFKPRRKKLKYYQKRK